MNVIGALIALDLRNRLRKVKKVVGVSAGSIIGLLWIAGYHPLEIAGECIDFSLLSNVRSIFDINIWIEITRITERLGAFSNKKLEERLSDLLERKFGVVPTLAQLELVTGKELICVSVNADERRTEYLSSKTHGSLSSVKAVLMSSNILGVFEHIEHNGCTYIDGAFRDPYPIGLLDDGKTPILGIYISNEYMSVKISKSADVGAILGFFADAYSSSINELYRRSLKDASPMCKHLILPALTMDTVGLTVSISTKMRMLVVGFLETMKMINQLSAGEG